jgi:anti-repressor protein
MRYGIVEGVTAGDVIETAGVSERKGLRGLAQFVSRRLERYHIARGLAMREGKLGAARARLFDPSAAKTWLREGGKLAIERWVSERTKRPGQGVLRLVPLGEGAPAA